MDGKPHCFDTMKQRPAQLTTFIEATRQAAWADIDPNTEAGAGAERIFHALETPGNIAEIEASQSLDAYRHLSGALDQAAAGSTDLSNLSDALRGLAPLLRWERRENAETQGERFYAGHANTTIVGPQGLEQRSDVIVGVSLVAPDVWYPEHNHPPEELYIVMSEGDWYREDKGWYTPGKGTVIYHRPWVTHAMRSAEQPLLAVWCLWAGSS